MLTHKDMIVRLYLQGLSVLEIARQTCHNPRSVDACLKTLDSVLILYLYGLSPIITSVIDRSESLIDEYLDLIAIYFKDVNTMRDHLRKKGVKLPANIPNIG